MKLFPLELNLEKKTKNFQQFSLTKVLMQLKTLNDKEKQIGLIKL